jgi:tRNA(Leu) C34 or U34 (ribose-2'-O)-methylase TrmL
MSRGFFGIGIVNGKFDANVGQLLRTGCCFGADFLYSVGQRYKNTPTNTVHAERHIPFYEYSDIEDMLSHRPYGCQPICIELKPQARNLSSFVHPERAIYILGQEDGSLPDDLCLMFPTIYIDTLYCLNVCVAGSIVLYDRKNKECTK